MDNLQNQKINLLKKISDIKKAIGGSSSSNKPVQAPKSAPNAPKNNPDNGSRGCGACSRKKNS
jgi:hypothetical protein